MRPAHRTRLPDRLVALVEQSRRIDTLAAPVHRAASTVSRSGAALRGALSGTGLGHPAHPAIVVGPLGCWTGALVADLTGESSAARRLTGAGVLLAAPAIATGLSDWADTTGAEQRVGFVHLCANLATLGAYTASWRARRRGDRRSGVAFGLLGAAGAATSGWLGGHLTYRVGVGVDTTAFDGGPTEWTLVARDAENPRAGSAAGVPLLIVETDAGTRVLADRCTHRGGPLSQGTITDDCVTCPWHGSRFSLLSGAVEAGPAVAPQPIYETQTTPRGLYVRRSELRSLRVNPVRAPDSER
jgi:nitrite reductase/ring-hydroxylating ferredoxin subunit/uncharacterized membrane protein